MKKKNIRFHDKIRRRCIDMYRMIVVLELDVVLRPYACVITQTNLLLDKVIIMRYIYATLLPKTHV